MSDKIKKIVSGKNITVVANGKPRMFMCGESNNQYLFDYLSMCDDPDKINKILSDPLYENYIKTYNEYPVDQSLFDHGHKVYYICADKMLKSYYRTQENKVVGVSCIKMPISLADAAVPLGRKDIEEARAVYMDARESEPVNLITCCIKCLTIQTVHNLITDTIQQISQESINYV